MNETLQQIYDRFADTYEENRGLFDMTCVFDSFNGKLKIEKGKYYLLKMKVTGRELDYKCKVIDVSKDKLKVVDSEGERLNFHTYNLMHFEEIDKSEVEREIGPLKVKKRFY